MSEVEAGQAADDGRASDQTRRRFLTAATSGVSAVGVVGVAVPFMASWNPSEKAKAAGAPVKADISKIEPGQMVVVEWRGKPVYVLRRTPEQIAGLPSLCLLLPAQSRRRFGARGSSGSPPGRIVVPR